MIICLLIVFSLGGASGLALLTSICSGITFQTFSKSPMSQSTSPSDFWGNRWDRPVASGLKRGCFFPLYRIIGRHGAALGTFFMSGLLHEFLLLLCTRRGGTRYNNPSGLPYQPKYGNQFLFFAWNGLVLLGERGVEGWSIIHLCRKYMPKPIRTLLVLLTVLPIAHLFTDEYVENCFLGDAAFAFPRITYLGTAIGQ
jgi:hypothetical protein